MGLFNKLASFIPKFPEKKINTTPSQPIVQDESYRVNYYVRDLMDSIWSGEKFIGSYGTTKNYTYIDYYVLRKRSVELFKNNQYARGIIRRLLTNIIYTGLNLEANPLSQIIGKSDEETIDWAEKTELKWELWSRDPYICDFNQLKNLGQLEIDIKQTALISGDCLVVLRINPKTGLPSIEVIDGCHIQTPLTYKPREGNTIRFGIEFDSRKRQVAYHVYTENPKGGYEYKRIPAYGEKSGRRIAWLIYGSDRLLDECRGEPILSNMLYMLKELDRYRDASARAAVVNSLYPFLIKQTEKSFGEMPFGAVKKTDTVQVANDPLTTTTVNFGYDNPGTITKLPYGMDIANLSTQKSDVNLGKFEEIILNVFAWTLEVPPEIVKLLFQSNYSASRQANNELQVLINKQAWLMGCDFLQSLYEEWVISNVLIGNIEAPGLLDAWYNGDWQLYNAWLNCEFTGLSRPSVDGLKDVQEEELKLKLGVGTFDSATRKLSRMKFRTVVQKRRIEQDLMKRFNMRSSIDEDSQGQPVIPPAEDVNGQLDEMNNRLMALEGRK